MSAATLVMRLGLTRYNTHCTRAAYCIKRGEVIGSTHKCTEESRTHRVKRKPVKANMRDLRLAGEDNTRFKIVLVLGYLEGPGQSLATGKGCRAF